MGTKVKITVAFILDMIIRVLDYIRSCITGGNVADNKVEYRQDVQENRDAAEKIKDYIKDKTISEKR